MAGRTKGVVRAFAQLAMWIALGLYVYVLVYIAISELVTIVLTHVLYVWPDDLRTGSVWGLIVHYYWDSFLPVKLMALAGATLLAFRRASSLWAIGRIYVYVFVVAVFNAIRFGVEKEELIRAVILVPVAAVPIVVLLILKRLRFLS